MHEVPFVLKEEVKPCPFCGSTKISGYETKEEDLSRLLIMFSLCCDNFQGGCGIRTAYYCTAQDAINAWNKRVSK